MLGNKRGWGMLVLIIYYVLLEVGCELPTKLASKLWLS